MVSPEPKIYLEKTFANVAFGVVDVNPLFVLFPVGEIK